MGVVLKVRDIYAGYRDQPVVHGLSMHANRGNLVCLPGPSGCGKTTVLCSIAGFEPLRKGEIHIDGRIVSRPGLTVSPEQRRLGMVFQDNALFPHLTVAGNIAFSLRGRPVQVRRGIVAEMLAMVGLEDIGRRYPHTLSGGQQQRVALARALAPHPDMVLLDEPFSSLDVELRERLSVEVRNILKELGITTVLVTHDQHEAFSRVMR